MSRRPRSRSTRSTAQSFLSTQRGGIWLGLHPLSLRHWVTRPSGQGAGATLSSFSVPEPQHALRGCLVFICSKPGLVSPDSSLAGFCGAFFALHEPCTLPGLALLTAGQPGRLESAGTPLPEARPVQPQASGDACLIHGADQMFSPGSLRLEQKRQRVWVSLKLSPIHAVPWREGSEAPERPVSCLVFQQFFAVFVLPHPLPPRCPGVKTHRHCAA